MYCVTIPAALLHMVTTLVCRGYYLMSPLYNGSFCDPAYNGMETGLMM